MQKKIMTQKWKLVNNDNFIFYINVYNDDNNNHIKKGSIIMSKRRTFKVYENDTIMWSGKSHKFSSTMQNTDIKMAIKTGDWSNMIDVANRGLARRAYNREHNIHNQAVYDRHNNAKFNKLKMRKVS